MHNEDRLRGETSGAGQKARWCCSGRPLTMKGSLSPGARPHEDQLASDVPWNLRLRHRLGTCRHGPSVAGFQAMCRRPAMRRARQGAGRVTQRAGCIPVRAQLECGLYLGAPLPLRPLEGRTRCCAEATLQDAAVLGVWQVVVTWACRREVCGLPPSARSSRCRRGAGRECGPRCGRRSRRWFSDGCRRQARGEPVQRPSR